MIINTLLLLKTAQTLKLKKQRINLNLFNDGIFTAGYHSLDVENVNKCVLEQMSDMSV